MLPPPPRGCRIAESDDEASMNELLITVLAEVHPLPRFVARHSVGSCVFSAQTGSLKGDLVRREAHRRHEPNAKQTKCGWNDVAEGCYPAVGFEEKYASLHVRDGSCCGRLPFALIRYCCPWCKTRRSWKPFPFVIAGVATGAAITLVRSNVLTALASFAGARVEVNGSGLMARRSPPVVFVACFLAAIPAHDRPGTSSAYRRWACTSSVWIPDDRCFRCSWTSILTAAPRIVWRGFRRQRYCALSTGDLRFICAKQGAYFVFAYTLTIPPDRARGRELPFVDLVVVDNCTVSCGTPYWSHRVPAGYSKYCSSIASRPVLGVLPFSKGTILVPASMTAPSRPQISRKSSAQSRFITSRCADRASRLRAIGRYACAQRFLVHPSFGRTSRDRRGRIPDPMYI